jgi:hypothetical protein
MKTVDKSKIWKFDKGDRVVKRFGDVIFEAARIMLRLVEEDTLPMYYISIEGRSVDFRLCSGRELESEYELWRPR